MVQAQVANHRHLRRVNYVGGVQFPSHAHLQNHDVAPVPGKVLHGNGRHQLKLCGMVRHGLGVGLDELCDFGQLFICNVRPIYVHPLVKPEEEGGSVQAGAVACLAKDGGGHGRRRALAVGSGDVDKLQLLFRISHAAK